MDKRAVKLRAIHAYPVDAPMTDRRTRAWRKGAEAAAGVASQYNGSTTHPYRLDDCILGKLNVREGKPRRNAHRMQQPKDAWICGFAVGVADMHRRLLGGSDSAGVVGVCAAAGLTIEKLKKAGVPAFDWKELKRAGVS